jgi:hypothetical protein
MVGLEDLCILQVLYRIWELHQIAAERPVLKIGQTESNAVGGRDYV